MKYVMQIYQDSCLFQMVKLDILGLFGVSKDIRTRKHQEQRQKSRQHLHLPLEFQRIHKNQCSKTHNQNEESWFSLDLSTKLYGISGGGGGRLYPFLFLFFLKGSVSVSKKMKLFFQGLFGPRNSIHISTREYDFKQVLLLGV